ncbi:pre-mRNA splicing regulator USH1G-like [Ptychodera flava]|uniref:pre-mRNA splicing regulator USH1G-like n=1 Tax=Ptychodera flava TaxID=63121 RepID=UPI00396A1040
MTDRFHQAAKDGYLDLLREATKKDCNRIDEDGRTPTMYASYYGNADALRLIVSRGGDPDKCDYQGNTPLHFASNNGHSNCVTFLVSFGCNIWALDNDHRTALDVAAMMQRMDIVNFLDGVAGKQASLNKKVVKKMKEKAILDADNRIKRYDKMAMKQEKKLEKQQKKMDRVDGHYVKHNGKQGAGHIDHKKQVGTFGGFTQPASNQNQRSVRSTTNASVMMMQSAQYGRAPLSSDLFDGRVVKPSGYSEPALNNDSGIDTMTDDTDREGSGLYDRPGFGNLMFLPKGNPSAMMSLPDNEDDEDRLRDNRGGKDDDDLDDIVNIEHQTNTSVHKTKHRSSTTSAGELPWDEDDIDLDDDEDDSFSSPLELFLAAHQLTDYLPLFTQEQIDLDALMLCSDNDLKSVGLPLGPRRKVLEAIARRKAVLNEPGPITDTVL